MNTNLIHFLFHKFPLIFCICWKFLPEFIVRVPFTFHTRILVVYFVHYKQLHSKHQTWSRRSNKSELTHTSHRNTKVTLRWEALCIYRDDSYKVNKVRASKLLPYFQKTTSFFRHSEKNYFEVSPPVVLKLFTGFCNFIICGLYTF